MLKNICCALCLGLSLTAFSQVDKRPTQEQVLLERDFIEAKSLVLLYGDFDKAEKRLQKLDKNYPNEPSISYELAKLYVEQKKYNKAIGHLQEAVKLAPDNTYYLDALGLSYEANSQWADAVEVYEKLVKLEPRNEQHYYSLAYYHSKNDKLEKSAEVYNDLEKIIGIHEEIINRKFLIYKSLGKSSKAISELEKLIAEYPDSPKAYHELANYYIELKEEKKAAEVYKEILTFSPSDPRANLELAVIAQNNGDELAYLGAMKKVFQDSTINIDLKIQEFLPQIQKIAISKNQEYLDACKDLANTLVEAHPAEAKAYSMNADVLYYAGDSEQALTQYIKSTELNPTILAVWENLMYIQSDLKQDEDLIKSSNQVIDLFPNEALGYYLNGVANQSLSKDKLAIQSFEEALLRSGANVNRRQAILTELGGLYNDAKQYKQSDDAFDKVLKLNPENVLVLNNYSYFLSLREERLEDALKMSQKANELSPDQFSFQDTYAWIFYKSKQYEEAKVWIEKALKNGGHKYGEVLEHYGDILYRLNAKEDALDYWNKAAEKGGASNKILEKIKNKALEDE